MMGFIVSVQVLVPVPVMVVESPVHPFGPPNQENVLAGRLGDAPA
jgi:hypothetical protein